MPNRSRIKENFGGTIKGSQWYGLGTRSPKSYHSVLFFLANHNFPGAKYTNVMLWHNQDNDVTYVRAKQHFATMHTLQTIFFIP